MADRAASHAELERLAGQVSERGFTLVPTRLYFAGGRAKVEIAVGRGKDRFDKREDLDGSGGFIAYRASKAGLNAAWKSVALALAPKGVTAMVMHPGWVATDMGGRQAPTTPEQSVTGMRKVIAGLGPSDAGTFRAFDGRTLPW